MTELTTTQEQAIRERLAAAIGGPWKNTWEEEDDWHIITGPPTEIDGDWLDRPVIATVDGQDPANAEFIAHAREDIPALLAEVDRLRDELAKTREITEDEVCYGGHAIWLESETSLCGMHECRYYGDVGDADYSCQCARCEETAQLYARAALDALLGGEDERYKHV